MTRAQASRPWWQVGLLRVYWRSTYGENGWELAGKGAAAWIGGSLLTAASGADDVFHIWNPVHVLCAVLVLWGVGALVAGLVREYRRARMWLASWSTAEPVLDGSALEAMDRASSAFETSPPASSLGDSPVGRADDPQTAAGRTANNVAEADGAVIADDEAVQIEVAAKPATLPIAVSPTASPLRRAQARNRQGGAGEKYVAMVLGDLPPSDYAVTSNLVLPVEDLGRYVGNIDFFVERLGRGAAAVIEAKTTHPAVRVDGRPVGASHRSQTASLARAVSELDDLEVAAIVVYVDAVGTESHRLRRMEPRVDVVDGLIVTSTGARHLKGVLAKVLGGE